MGICGCFACTALVFSVWTVLAAESSEFAETLILFHQSGTELFEHFADLLVSGAADNERQPATRLQNCQVKG